MRDLASSPCSPSQPPSGFETPSQVGAKAYEVAGDAARVGLIVSKAAECAPYPELGSLAVGGSSGSNSAPTLAAPLRLQVPGHIFNIYVEEMFDLLFRDFGPGSFQDALWTSSHGRCLNLPLAWEPAPAPRAASAVVASREDDAGGAGGGCPGEGWGGPVGIPRVRLKMHRPVIAPQWVRYFLELPESCTAEEDWALHGFGHDSSFVIEAKDSVSGIPYSDCFVVRRRYKVTSVGESRTQLDAEYQIEWLKPCMVKGRVESGTLEGLSTDFVEKFLPLVKRTLTARFGEPARVSDVHDGCSLQISPQDWALTSGSLDCSGLPDEGLDWRLDGRLDASAPKYEIFVEVRSVQIEEVDEVQDFEADAVWMATAGHVDALFLELRLGERRLQTQRVAGRRTGGELRAHLIGELLLFGYSGERNLLVRICSWQQLHAAMNGNQHPILGESVLALDQHMFDLEPRCVVLPIWLSSERVGLVKLQYQALLLHGPCVVAEGPASAAESAKRPARLRVELLGVFSVPNVELSLHELLSSVTSDELLPPEQVFAELQLGAHHIETAGVEMPGDAESVQFKQTVALFTYGGEDSLEVRVLSRRWPKELVSEVFIGSGALQLECVRSTCEPQMVDLPVSRAGMVTGLVSLRYQLFV